MQERPCRLAHRGLQRGGTTEAGAISSDSGLRGEAAKRKPRVAFLWLGEPGDFGGSAGHLRPGLQSLLFQGCLIFGDSGPLVLSVVFLQTPAGPRITGHGQPGGQKANGAALQALLSRCVGYWNCMHQLYPLCYKVSPWP